MPPAARISSIAASMTLYGVLSGYETTTWRWGAAAAAATAAKARRGRRVSFIVAVVVLVIGGGVRLM